MHKRNIVSSSRPVNITCVECGKEFHAPPSQIADGRKYCSHACRAAVTGRAQKGVSRNAPAWNRIGDRPLTAYERVKRYLSRKRTSAGFVYCACGCGEKIPALTAQGKQAKYKQEHQPGNPATAWKKGHQTWNRGVCGVDSHSYVNGGSFEPYPPTFNKNLKERIRARDNYTCQKCGEKWGGGKRFTVHHIDYDKSNCHESNLITLCGRCNLSANNRREYWKDYFTHR